MCGAGKLYYPNGQLAYEGKFYNNKFNGEGVVYNENITHDFQHYDYTNFDKLAENWIKYVGSFKNDFKVCPSEK